MCYRIGTQTLNESRRNLFTSSDHKFSQFTSISEIISITAKNKQKNFFFNFSKHHQPTVLYINIIYLL